MAVNGVPLGNEVGEVTGIVTCLELGRESALLDACPKVHRSTLFDKLEEVEKLTSAIG